MKISEYLITRLDADDGKVFDYAVPHYEDYVDEDGEMKQRQYHLYAKTVFVAPNDSINNYVEVDAPNA